MALPIRPTPVLTGRDAERLEEYMAESETHKEPLRYIVVDEDKMRSAIAAIRARKKQTRLVRV